MAHPTRKLLPLILAFMSLSSLIHAKEGLIQKNVLILGDSHAYSLKDSFSDWSSTNKWHIDVKGISSSGLARRDFYDWIAFARSEESRGYDLYVVILGTNDGQNSRGSADEKFGTRDWEYLYTARAESLITELQKRGDVLWLSIPPIREEHMKRKIEYLQALIDEVCRYHGVEQLDLGNSLTPRMRREDGIHFTQEGVKFVSAALERELDELF